MSGTIAQNEKKEVRVAAAALVFEGRLLVTQRGAGQFKDCWELPGGKVELGETYEDCLVREMEEELSLAVSVGDKICTLEHEYPDFKLKMQVLSCTFANEDHNLTLNVHEGAKWALPSELDDLNWLPADYKILDKLKEFVLNS